MPLTTADRRRNGRKGALKTLTKADDWSELTAPARAAGPASLEWHARRLGLDVTMPREQRDALARIAKKDWYADLNARALQARAPRRADQAPAPVAAGE
jgi:hypothetical protein